MAQKREWGPEQTMALKSSTRVLESLVPTPFFGGMTGPSVLYGFARSLGQANGVLNCLLILVYLHNISLA